MRLWGPFSLTPPQDPHTLNSWSVLAQSESPAPPVVTGKGDVFAML